MKFSDVLDIRNGRNQCQVEDANGKYPIYGSGGVMGHATDFICDAGTVVIGRKGSINNPIFVDEPFWNVDTAFGLVAHRDVLLPKYLYYFCVNFDFEQLNTTVTIPSLTKANLLQIEINIPDLDEQRHVVSVLDKICRLADLQQQELHNLNQLVKSRFIELFGRTPGKEKVSMAEICRIITDGTHQPPQFVDKGIPFLFVSNIVTNEICYETERFISEETYTELIKRTPIEIGDVLLSTVGSYGHPAVVKRDKRFCFQRHIAYLKPDSERVDSEYLRGAILSPGVQRQINDRVKGIAQKTLNLSEIRKIKLPLPPIDQQKQFAAFVEQTDKSKYYSALCIESVVSHIANQRRD